MSDVENVFRRLVVLRLQKDRAKEARRSREHAAQRLTWVSSQQSQPDEPAPRFHEERTEEDEMEDVTVEMAKIVKPLTRERLASIINEKSPNDDFVTFLRALLDVSSAKSKEGVTRSVWAFDLILERLGSDLDIGRCDDVIGELLMRTHNLSDGVLAFLAERSLESCLRGFSKAVSQEASPTRGSPVTGAKPSRLALNGILEILTKLVFRICTLPRGLVDPETRCKENLSDMDGESYRLHILERLCRAQWNSDALLPLLSAVRELCSKTTQSRAAIVLAVLEKKALQYLPQIDEKNLPEFCSQLLALSGLFSDRKLTMDSLIEHFESCEVESVAPRILGQVLSKLSMAASQDAPVGSSFMKVLEHRPRWSVTTLCMLMSLGRVKRFEKTVIDAVRKRAMAEAETAMRIRASPWLAHMEGTSETASLMRRFFESLCGVCDSAEGGGWDLIVPILVKCAIRLADENDSFCQSANPYFDVEQEDLKANLPVNVIVGSIGVRILGRCFRQFALVRSELLTEVINRALISAADKGALSFLRFFFLACHQSTQSARAVFADHSAIIKDLIALLPSVSPRVAHGLLRALAPGIESRSPFRDVRDHAMLVFRKALFQRDLNPRLIALFGLLTCCRVVPNAEQSTVPQAVEDAQRDAIGCLRRCLSQQYELKYAMYLALKHFPPSFRSDLLSSHLVNELIEPTGDTDLSPIQFEAAIDSSTGRIKDPIGALLRAMFLPNDPTRLWDPPSVVARMATASMPVFSLDKNSNFSTDVVQGCINRSTGNLVIESCEVLIDSLLLDLMMTRNPNAFTSSFACIDLSEAALGKIASLWRVQRAIRRLIQMTLDKQQQEQQDLAADDRKGKQKKKQKMLTAAAEEEEDDDDANVAEGSSKKKQILLQDEEDKAKKLEAAERFRLPAEGEWLSDDALVALVHLAADKASLSAILDSVQASVNAKATQPRRDDIASVLCNLGFHSYLMSAVRSRLTLLARSGRGPLSSNAVPHRPVELFGEMAESCAGAIPKAPLSFLVAIARPLVKIQKRYTSLLGMVTKPSVSGNKQADDEEGEENRTAQKKSAKKRKVASDQAQGVGANPAMLKVVAEVERLRESGLANVRDMLGLAVATGSSSALVSVVREAFSISEKDADHAISISAHKMYELLLDALAERRFASASLALDAASLLLLRPLSMGSSAIFTYDEHVQAFKQILHGYDVGGKSAIVVKQVVQLYLELSMRVDKNELGPAFQDVAQGLAREFSPDAADDPEGEDERSPPPKMMRGETSSQASLTTLVQVLSAPCLEECERVLAIDSMFSSQQKQTDLLHRLEGVCAVLGLLIGQNLPRGTMTELVLKCLIRTYKCCIKLFKGLAARKSAVAPTAIGKLVQFVWKNLTPVVDDKVKTMENSSSRAHGTDSSEGKKRERKGGKESARESKLIPEVVYNIEQYEVVLLKASKACEEIAGLSKYVRRTTARDFKLDISKVASALQERDEAEEGDNGVEEAEG